MAGLFTTTIPASRLRRRVVYVLPLIGAAAPIVAFFVSLRAAEHSRPLRGVADRITQVLITPGVFPGLLFVNPYVAPFAAALFWYLLAYVLLAELLLPRRARPRHHGEGILLRPTLWIGIGLLMYTCFIIRFTLGWNPD